MSLLLKRSLQVGLVLALLLLLVVSLLLFSHTGARLAFNFSTRSVDGLTVEGVEGRLVGPLVLQDVHYRAPGVSVDVEQATLEWRPFALFKRTLLVSKFEVLGTRLEISESPTEPEPFTGMVLPESLGLPLTVILQDVSMQEVAVATAGNTLSLAAVALTAKLESDTGSSSSDNHSDNHASVRWSGLNVLASEGGASLVSSDTGQLRVSGQTVSHAASGNAVLLWQGEREASLAFTGRGDRRSFTLNTVDASLLGGLVGGSARIDWSTGIAANVSLEGSEFDPAQLDERLSGDLGFSLRAGFDNNAATLEKLRLSGLLRDQVVDVSAAGAYASGSARVETLAGRLGSSHFNASGDIASNFDFEWQVDSPDLSALLPELGGKLKSAGTLKGSRDRPVLNGNFELLKAKYAEYSAESVAASVALDLMTADAFQTLLSTSASPITLPSPPQPREEKVKRPPSVVELRALGLQIGETTISSATVDVTGTQGKHQLEMNVDSDAGSVEAQLSGKFADGVWLAVLERGEVAPLALSGWVLEQTQPVSIAQNRLFVGRGCWRVETTGDDQSLRGRTCFSMEQVNENLSANVKLEALPLNYFSSLAPDELGMSGTISASGTVEKEGNAALQIAAELRSSASRLFRRDVDEDSSQLLQSLELEPGLVSLRGSADRMEATLDFPLLDGGGITGELSVTDAVDSASSQLGGRLSAVVPDLAFVALASPEIVSMDGAANLDVALSGSLAAPNPEGELKIANMQVSLATPGIALEGVTLGISADSEGKFSVQGTAQSDGGTLRVEGEGLVEPAMTSAASGLALTHFEAQVSGSDFQVWSTAEASVWGSPDIELRVTDNSMRITGDVIVPRATITPTQLPPSAVSPTADQIIVMPDDESGRQAALSGTPSSVFASLRLSLGDAVQIDGFGFSGGLAGDLGIELAPNKPVLASGELNVVGGEYRAFGQGLVVERGQLLFAGGDIENPGLNVRAQRRPAVDVVVGVNVTGQMQKPNLEVFSEPAMSSSNQLAWLVLGRPFETTSGAETDYIAQAALLLGIQGGDYLAKSLGDKLGLDTVGIETGSGEAGAASDVNQAALVVGKYLTPKLYISYGVGLLESISTVKLRYQISDRWNLVTESSPIASGGDVNFTIER